MTTTFRSPGSGLAPTLVSFDVLDAADPAQRARWEQCWSELGKGEIFSHPAYLGEMALAGERPHCAIARFAGGGALLYAFLLRPITHDAAGATIAPGYWDICTALVYGGPLGRDVSEAEMSGFWQRFAQWAASCDVVSEIIRFSPVATRHLPYAGTVRVQAPHVVRSLAGLEPQQIVAQMRPNARRNLRRAEQSGLRIEIDTTGARLEEFLEIYAETMDRVGADPRFRFRRELFEQIHRSFPGRFAYVHALAEGRAVSTDFMLYADGVGYYFLGGTRTEALRSGAHVAVSVAAMRVSLERGCTEHVLTGGVTNTPEDSLLEFKRRLAPEGLSEYCTGEQVFLPEVYAALTAAAPAGLRESGFFPLYRARRGADAEGTGAEDD